MKSCRRCGNGFKQAPKPRDPHSKFSLALRRFASHTGDLFLSSDPFCKKCISYISKYKNKSPTYFTSARRLIQANRGCAPRTSDRDGTNANYSQNDDIEMEEFEMRTPNHNAPGEVNNLSQPEARHVNQRSPSPGPSRVRYCSQEEWDKCERRISELEARISRVLEKCGLEIPFREGVEDIATYQNAINTVEQVTLEAESIEFDYSDAQQINAEAQYSESTNSMIPLNTRSSTTDSITILADSVPYTQSKCLLLCKDAPDKKASRKIVPMSAIADLFIYHRILLHPKSRSCECHVVRGRFTDDAKSRILQTRIRKNHRLRITPKDLSDLLTTLADHAIIKPGVLDFSNEENHNDEFYKKMLGVKKEHFETIFASVNSRLRDTKKLSGRNRLAIWLAKVRLGVSQAVVGHLFGITSQPTISKVFNEVTILLHKNFVPRYLGWDRKSREEAMTDHNKGNAPGILGIPPSSLNIIADGTYIHIEKPKNHKLQRLTYCKHKGYNLVKIMKFVHTDGTIIEASGPWYSNYFNNDAGILLALLTGIVDNGNDDDNDLKKLWSTDADHTSLIQPKDTFVLDRGFGPKEAQFRKLGYNVYLPMFLKKGQHQFTPQEANYNRTITMIRFAVEIRNASVKDYRFFDHRVPLPYIDHIAKIYQIVSAIVNLTAKPLLTDPEEHEHQIQVCNERLLQSNQLERKVVDENLENRRVIWESAALGRGDFPELSMEDLRKISLGAYQIENAIEYSKSLEFQVHKEEKGLIRVLVKSRHLGNTKYKCFIQYDNTREGSDKIVGWYCQCYQGARRIGTCSHVMAALWKLSYELYNPSTRVQRNYGDFIFDAAELLTNASNPEDLEPPIEEGASGWDRIRGNAREGLADMEQQHPATINQGSESDAELGSPLYTELHDSDEELDSPVYTQIS